MKACIYDLFIFLRLLYILLQLFMFVMCSYSYIILYIIWNYGVQ